MSIPLSLYTGPTAADLARIPEALQSFSQWVLFQLLEVPDAHGALKLTKIPIHPRTFRHGSSTTSATWGTYAQCVARLPYALDHWRCTPPTTYHEKPATYRGAGLGFVFTADDPFMLVDLDHSVDPATGTVATWAYDIVTTLQSYTQRSVSGTGLHVLVQATLPQGGHKQHGDVQMWDRGRFCAMTGWHLAETPDTIEARQSQLAMVHSVYIEQPKVDTAATQRKGQAPAPRSPRSSTNDPRSTWDERTCVEEALRHIPAEDRTTWYTMGMALHASGHPWARAVWDAWSQTSAKYDAKDQERVWQSFRTDGGITFGTLFHEAAMYGYLPPMRPVHGQTTPSPTHTPQPQDGDRRPPRVQRLRTTLPHVLQLSRRIA